MTKKTNRFYTTINEAKQLMKLSIYEKRIKDKADMMYIHEIVSGLKRDITVIDLGDPKYYPNATPAWSTDALIKVCNDLGLLTYIDSFGVLVECYSDGGRVLFTMDLRGTCLPWMLVKALKEYDKKYGTK